jgi:hypothetical protein
MANYDEVLSQVRLLTLHEQAQLLEELATLVNHRVKAWPKHSFLELEGLGKEVWEGVDVDKYIEEERRSWE